MVAAFALVLPMAAMGSDNSGKGNGNGGKTVVAKGLLENAASNPDATLKLIVTSSSGTSGAENAAKDADNGEGGLQVKRKLDLVGGVAIEIKAKKLAKLAEKSGLVITPDYRVHQMGDSSYDLWPKVTKVDQLWSKDAVTCAVTSLTCVASPAYTAPAAPTIAIVDSGVQARADFGTRLLGSVSLYSGTGKNSSGDGRGHGTMVAGLAAGGIAGLAGAAPNAKLVSVDVLDDAGVGSASDVIAAAEWILKNKDTYNIRVANFSLGAGSAMSARLNPLDRAVEKLWFSGVVVVASSGNYAVDGKISGVKYAPANDPFVITVGSSDTLGTVDTSDDTIAPWSSYGYTADGFRKPEVVAPGRRIYAPAPTTSTLYQQLKDRVVATGYMWMSGTSFSAAMVSGTAAQILARHPEYTPDRVKGALMVGAFKLPKVTSKAAGFGSINAARGSALATAPNPNLALNSFVVADPSGGSIPYFDGAAFYAQASSNMTWDETTWAETTWAEMGWAEMGWAENGWAEMGWAENGWAENTWAENGWAENTWAETTWSENTWAEGTEQE